MRSLHAFFVWTYWCFICICACVCVKYMMCVVGSGLGMSQSSRLSSSVSAMRVLNTGSDVEEALADALVNIYTVTHRNSPLTHKFTRPFYQTFTYPESHV